MKRILFIILSTLLVLFIVGCKNKTKEKETKKDEPNNEVQNGYVQEYTGEYMNYKKIDQVVGSIHQYKMDETNNYVLEDGKSNYELLLPDEASAALISFANEFINLFFEATNLKLEISYDSDFDENKNYFAISNNTLFNNSGIKLDYNQIQSQGFIIKTYNNSILINGFTEQACLNGVYEYMTLVANYRYLGPDTYTLNTNIKNIKLYNYDIIDAPDIEYRVGSYSFVNSSNMRKYRFQGSLFIPINGHTWHNTFDYLPPSTYKETHPKWYSVDGTQLCYSARGDNDELALMQEQVFEVLKQNLIAYLERNIVTFSIQDSNTFCTCPTCQESKLKYNGSNAALVVKFLNKISEKVDEWFNGDGSEYKRDLKILFFAYLSTNVAPAVIDEATNEYKPVDEEVRCRNNVCPFFADIRGDYTKSYYDETSANNQYATNLKAWTNCSSHIFVWTYSTNFHYYLTPYNSFDAMTNSYKFFVECKANYLYDQAQFNQGQSATGWSFLKEYITSRASWDCNLELNDLYDEFFSEFYSRDASVIMRELFNEYLVLANYQTNVLGYSGPNSIYHNPFQEKYWPKRTLLSWLEKFDDALSSINKYKDSAPGLYAKYYSHITAERVQYTYLLLKIYSSSLSEEELAFYKAQFHSDAESNGMLYESELANSLVTNILK